MTTNSRAAEIGAEGICKMFGSFTALDNISMTIGRGEFLTLLGPSGSGKTTFLMVLAGFEMPTRGRLTLDGKDVTKEPAEERAFGMVFQGYALFPHMSVEDNIAFPLKVQKRSAAQVKKRVQDWGLRGYQQRTAAALQDFVGWSCVWLQVNHQRGPEAAAAAWRTAHAGLASAGTGNVVSIWN